MTAPDARALTGSERALAAVLVAWDALDVPDNLRDDATATMRDIGDVIVDVGLAAGTGDALALTAKGADLVARFRAEVPR